MKQHNAPPNAKVTAVTALMLIVTMLASVPGTSAGSVQGRLDLVMGEATGLLTESQAFADCYVNDDCAQQLLDLATSPASPVVACLGDDHWESASYQASSDCGDIVTDWFNNCIGEVPSLSESESDGDQSELVYACAPGLMTYTSFMMCLANGGVVASCMDCTLNFKGDINSDDCALINGASPLVDLISISGPEGKLEIIEGGETRLAWEITITDRLDLVAPIDVEFEVAVTPQTGADDWGNCGVDPNSVTSTEGGSAISTTISGAAYAKGEDEGSVRLYPHSWDPLREGGLLSFPTSLKVTAVIEAGTSNKGFAAYNCDVSIVGTATSAFEGTVNPFQPFLPPAVYNTVGGTDLETVKNVISIVPLSKYYLPFAQCNTVGALQATEMVCGAHDQMSEFGIDDDVVGGDSLPVILEGPDETATLTLSSVYNIYSHKTDIKYERYTKVGHVAGQGSCYGGTNTGHGQKTGSETDQYTLSDESEEPTWICFGAKMFDKDFGADDPVANNFDWIDMAFQYHQVADPEAVGLELFGMFSADCGEALEEAILGSFVPRGELLESCLSSESEENEATFTILDEPGYRRGVLTYPMEDGLHMMYFDIDE